MAEKRGAIQLSMGFIITVVIAIILLGLAITWIQGMFGSITGLTEDLTQQAQTNLRETFKQTGGNFAIWPNQYELDRGKGIRMSAGIENDAPDGQPHFFVINIVPTSASSNICPGGDVTTCPSVQSKMMDWVTIDRSKTRIAINTQGFKYIDVSIPSDAIAGTYFYNVMSCYDAQSISPSEAATPTSMDCTSVSDKLWGNPQQLLVIVK
jgi:hypothetical protein